MTGGPWYNIYVCKKTHGKVFEIFIRNARTDRYNDLVHPKMSPTLSFYGIYRKQVIYLRNKANAQ